VEIESPSYSQRRRGLRLDRTGIVRFDPVFRAVPRENSVLQGKVTQESLVLRNHRSGVAL
jgi:hypothetical protein